MTPLLRTVAPLVLLSAAACAASVDTAPVARRDLVESTIASGRVVLPARIQIGAMTGGVVADVPVDEGAVVKRGDPLVRFDDRAERAAVAQARAEVAQARARLLEVTDVTGSMSAQELARAEAELTQVIAALARAELLAKAGGITVVDVEEARTRHSIALSRRDAAQVQARASAKDGAAVRMAEALLQSAEAGLEAATVRLDQTRVIALTDGVVLARDVEPGDAVVPGRTLLVLGRTGETQIEVQPDERALSVLAVGQRATCTVDAFPSAPFSAVVATIAPIVDAARGTVEVKLRVPQPPPFLKTDMTVNVEIVTGEKPQAVVVPTDAVRDLAGAEPWVLVVGDDGRVARRPISIGARGLGVVEVKSGADVGETVVVGAPKVKDGARVKSKPSGPG